MGGPGGAGRQSGCFFANEGETWVRDASPIGETLETDGDGQIRAPARSFPLAYSLACFHPSFLPSFLLRFSQRSVQNPFLTSILDLWRCGHAQNFQHDFDADGSHEVRAYRALFGSFLCRYRLIDCPAAVVVLSFLLFLFCSPPPPHTYHPLLVLSRFFVQ